MASNDFGRLDNFDNEGEYLHGRGTTRKTKEHVQLTLLLI